MLSVLLLPTGVVNAQYGVSQPPSRQLLIDKKVLDPRNNQFVDNLIINQFLFLPEQEVKFRIEVRNTGQTDWQNISVRDVLPKEVTFVAGQGTYDTNTHILTFTINELKAGDSKFLDLTVKVKSESELGFNVNCVSNLVEMSMDKSVQQDTASFCIQKKVLGVVSELPITGPKSMPILFVSTILFGLGVLSLWRFKSNRGGQK